MYGMDVYYLPREFVREASIMREVTSSAFNAYFIIEAYLNNFDGYGGQGDIMSKFGIQVKDEITLTISRERYENYIAPFLNSRLLFQMQTGVDNSEIVHRPREGDLVYFPLGRRLFEIKFVEHEQPFYQLGNGYTYELQCELFEYEDEVLDTTVDEIDSVLGNRGDITTIQLIRISDRAKVAVGLATGYIRELEVLNEGNNFQAPPNIIIEPPEIGIDPEVVSILTQPTVNSAQSSIKQLIVFNSGAGYTKNPNVRVDGGGGTGAVVRAKAGLNGYGVVTLDVEDEGAGYVEDADIVIYDSSNNIVARGLGLTNGNKIVKAVITDPGENLDADTFAVVDEPVNSGTGTYIFNEIVVGRTSGTRARVMAWDQVTLTLNVTNIDPREDSPAFTPGEVILGESSGARYSIGAYDDQNVSADGYQDNQEIQDVADVIVDTTEFNQFDTEDDFSFNTNNPFGEF
jgi:hypothetical protein